MRAAASAWIAVNRSSQRINGVAGRPQICGRSTGFPARAARTRSRLCMWSIAFSPVLGGNELASLELGWAFFPKGPGSFHPIFCRAQEGIKFRLDFQAFGERKFPTPGDGLFGILDCQRGT